MTDLSYKSSTELEARIVASIVRDSEFFRAYFNCIDASYFQQESHRLITEQVLLFVSKYTRQPDQVELEHVVSLYLRSTTTNKQRLEELLPVYARDIKELFSVPIELLKVAQEYAVDFAKDAAFKKALMQSAKNLNEPGALQAAQRRLGEAALVGLDMDDFGLDYFKDARERHIQRLTQPPEMLRVPFLIPKIDAVVGGVGYRKYGGVPEMCIFLAPTNRGKSKALCHCAKVALSLGLNTVIFTAEMAAELYAERLDMSISGFTTDELYNHDNVPEVEQRLNLYKAQGGRLFIKKYPSRQVSIEQTVALLYRMKTALNFTPEVLIYDYIDEFAPPKSGGDQRRHQLSAITSAIRAAGDEFGAATFSATQANRDALKQEIVELSHVAEDIGKVNIADIIIGICQTEEEEQKSPPEQRWLFCKFRAKSKGLMCRVVDDTYRMRIMQHPEEKEDELARK